MDRIASSTRHFLEVLDELNRIRIEFVSFRENIDTGGPLGRAIVVIIGAVAELERSLIVERVRAGMRRARLEGQHIGRNPLVLDRAAIQSDREHGQSFARSPKAIASQRRRCNACLKCRRSRRTYWTHSKNQPEPDPFCRVTKGV